MRREQVVVILVSLLVTASLGGLAYYFREVLPPWAMGAMVGAPMLGGLTLLLLIRPARREEVSPPKPKKTKIKEEAPPEKPLVSQEKPVTQETPPEAYIAAFIGTLQKEGRFLDFLHEDLDNYDDAQIGAAVRAIHRQLKQALFEMIEITPVIDSKEGSEILIEEDFDRKAIRLIGNVKGKPPFRGILRHPGWRYKKINLPKPREEKILAPAEVEIS
ncbi:hypothetical protein Thein_1067 [Thermodesulfatator indicus DSM 15286]|uniref:DUF2760 domain-containing protein n=1 Tax=Thermodesulfatator indicus (strain DSM 15286 / JCM 11887 / CIR29812) TaxID=667014 RepID=F8ADX3_THEID|nr:DUF2760 domain-containing protein [Thermodesulfatator indicus]AEH44938.1 hypothetical protein Thein_1067 [Thermodesulfatator indicus DSM 15286]